MTYNEKRLLAYKESMCTDGINVSPVGLSLRVLKWITVNLTGATNQKTSTHSLCQSQHVERAHHICLVHTPKQDKNQGFQYQPIQFVNKLIQRKKSCKKYRK